jgi:hypothetical protein
VLVLHDAAARSVPTDLIVIGQRTLGEQSSHGRNLRTRASVMVIEMGSLSRLPLTRFDSWVASKTKQSGR